MKKKKFLIGAVLVPLAFGLLGVQAFRSFATYYYTVSEFYALPDRDSGKLVRLGGKVSPDSIQQDAKSMTLKFVLADEQKSLPVAYKGVVPDTFKPGADVVVEGRLQSSGIFAAERLIAKCPSRYEPAS